MKSNEEVTRNGLATEESMMAPLEGRCEVGDFDPTFDVGERTTWKVVDGKRVQVPENEAWVVSSQTHDDDVHQPVIDVDVPMRYVPSTTPGHGHIYFDVDMTWEAFENLLIAMADAGLVEEGYVRASIEREATFVRLPWVRKVDPK